MKELTIVWQRARNSVWEDNWVEYLFKDIPHRTIENLKHDQFIDNSVIVDAICWAPYHNEYISRLKSKEYNFGLIHLTDERRTDDISSYKDCKFVLRNYYKENMPDNVLHIPLGWNTGFTDISINPASADRTYIWAFVGERWDHNRNLMLAQLNQVPNGKLYVANHHGPRLIPSDMSKIYRNSIFVPCPSGAIIIDSFRVTEALEAGCIPIVEKSNYWFDSHGSDFPAIQLDNWGEIYTVISSFLKDPNLLEDTRLKCKDWWEHRKLDTIAKVTDLVNRTMF